MFDFGFSEILLVALVALIVVGPERLPKVARTAGHLLGRLQRYVSDVKSDISREMQLEDLKKLQQQVEQQARELESTVRTQMEKVESDLGQTASEVRRDVSESLEGAAVGASEEAVRAPVADAAPALPEGRPEGEEPPRARPDPQLELGLGSTGEGVRGSEGDADKPSGKPAEQA